MGAFKKKEKLDEDGRFSILAQLTRVLMIAECKPMLSEVAKGMIMSSVDM